jgi:hypothetical protein
MLVHMSERGAPARRTSSDRRRTSMRRQSTAMRVFMALMGIGCLGLAVASVVAIASGGYRPERYGDGFDPVRAGVLLAFGAITAGFALATAAGLRSLWSEPGVVPLSGVAFWAGLTIGGAAVFVFFAWAPSTSAPLVVPSPVRAMLFLGLGLCTASMVAAAAKGVPGAVRRRDPNLLIALIALALIVIVRFVWRD